MLGKMIYALSSAMREEGKVTAVEGQLASEGTKVLEPLKRGWANLEPKSTSWVPAFLRDAPQSKTMIA